jgi:hypothetical protein
MLKASRDCRRAIIRRDGPVAQRMQLIEKKLDVGNYVISDEHQGSGFGHLLAHVFTV